MKANLYNYICLCICKMNPNHGHVLVGIFIIVHIPNGNKICEKKPNSKHVTINGSLSIISYTVAILTWVFDYETLSNCRCHTGKYKTVENRH